MNYRDYIKENYQVVKRNGDLTFESGIYNFHVSDRKAGRYKISEVNDDFVVIEDDSSFSVISRVIIPVERFVVLHNVDKDLVKRV